METRTEHRVVWFPPDVSERSKNVASRAEADKLAEQHRRDNPFIEERTVTASDWQIVRNLAMEDRVDEVAPG